MNSTKQNKDEVGLHLVWEICKFWILQNNQLVDTGQKIVWEICKFWILQNRERNEARERVCLRDM